MEENLSQVGRLPGPYVKQNRQGCRGGREGGKKRNHPPLNSLEVTGGRRRPNTGLGRHGPSLAKIAGLYGENESRVH